MRPSQVQALRDMGLIPWRPRTTPSADADIGNVASESLADTAAVSLADSASAPVVQLSRPSREQAEEPRPEQDDASSYSNWAELEAAVAVCTRCALAAGRNRSVFGIGARNARWLLVGEAPGAEEDRRGEPFVGRAGKLLDAMLAALDLKREEVFITNIVKCRPPGNRDPKPEEAAACRPYLDKQIEWIEPKLILALGRVAAQQVLGVDTPVGRLRGRVHEGPRATPVVVTYHPAYLLRTPSAKRQAWEDLKLAVATAAPCA